MHKPEPVIEILKIQVAREKQLRCPHNASDRNRTGIFTFSRTKGDLIIWPAIISRHFRHRKREKPWYNRNSSSNPHSLVQIAKSCLSKTTALSSHTTDRPDCSIAHRLKNGDNALYRPPFRRVRRGKAPRPGNRKGMHFLTKKIYYFGRKRKKTETCRVKTDSTLRPYKTKLCPQLGRTADAG